MAFSQLYKIVIKKPTGGRRLIFLSGLIFSILIALLYIYKPTFLRFLDHKLYDSIMKSVQSGDISGVPVIVDLDEKSLARFGQWPWPRYRLAILLEKIRRLDPLMVGMDMVFAEPDRTSFDVAERQLGASSFLKIARQIAYCHHERWDGTGYPQGLKGEEIPVAARLMSIADVYDALINRRIYKEPFTHEEAVQMMAQERGTHFDSDILDAFLDLHEEFRRIAMKFADQKAHENILVFPEMG